MQNTLGAPLDVFFLPKRACKKICLLCGTVSIWQHCILCKILPFWAIAPTSPTKNNNKQNNKQTKNGKTSKFCKKINWAKMHIFKEFDYILMLILVELLIQKYAICWFFSQKNGKKLKKIWSQKEIISKKQKFSKSKNITPEIKEPQGKKHKKKPQNKSKKRNFVKIEKHKKFPSGLRKSLTTALLSHSCVMRSPVGWSGMDGARNCATGENLRRKQRCAVWVDLQAVKERGGGTLTSNANSPTCWEPK